MNTTPQFNPLQPSRRQMLRSAACGFGSLALAGLCADAARADAKSAVTNPYAPRPAHFPARAKRVIFLFQHGGVSQMDSFDPKPQLNRDHDKPLPYDLPGPLDETRMGKLYRVPWKWAKHGQCGQPVSELFPYMAQHVDKMAFIKSVHTEGQAHGQAVLRIHTGEANFIRPSIGSWVSYGLGSENDSMPAFIAIGYPSMHGGVTNYGSAFLPTSHQGTLLAVDKNLKRAARVRHLANPRLGMTEQRSQLDLIQSLNRAHVERQGVDPKIEGLIQSYELAFRMQTEAPELFDLSSESEATLEMYGIGAEPTDDYGRRCLLARRMAEAGVRFIQVATPYHWDHHGDIDGNMIKSSAMTDKPIGGLLADLEQRGLLDDTLVLWSGEFGRTPIAQVDSAKPGRDHNPHGFTIWMAGGGVKPGHSHGETDAYGFVATEGRVHMHDLHATILHLMGLDHERLTYRYAGRDFRLTDVYGHVVHEVIA